ncbi:galactose oxidase [Aulographum hederae CBS 113979]|uniref:Galactose oxidase n=1 Tax=Aulographum hederae CBS 113979 TaxID=1176131 RepID=A0A6G1H6X4_9PEZI|nr:galactose oxidase [Aulographum hederae CBS 113979]
MSVTEEYGTLFWNASARCAVFDPKADKWTELADVPKGRAVGSAAVGVSGSKILLAGGLLNTNLTDGAQDTVTLMSVYDVESRKWEVLPDMPEPRDHAGVGMVRGVLYVLGGRSFGNLNVVDTVFGYDIKKRIWKRDLAKMPTGRGGCGSATFGDVIFTFGGEGDPETASGVWPQTEGYDVVRNRWMKFKDMDVPRHGTGAVAVGKRIYISGGGLTIGGDPSNYSSYFSVSRKFGSGPEVT